MEKKTAQDAKFYSERRVSDSDGRALTHLTAVAEQHTDTHENDEEADYSDNNRDSAITTQSDAAARPMQLSPVAPFVTKAYAIVNGESDAIVSWWESDGEDTFVIKRVDVFQEQVLPRFFSHRNYSSFVRQLNNHGFSRVRSPSSGGGSMGGDGSGARSEQEAGWWEFKHPKFCPGHRELLSGIKRRKEKKRSVSTTSGSLGSFAGHPSGRVDHTDIGGDVTPEVRSDTEDMRREMHGMNRKLDELKSLVVGLLVYVRNTSGQPAAQQPQPHPLPMSTDAHGDGPGAGFAPGMNHFVHQHQQHKAPPAPPPPPTPLPPPQQRKQQQHEQHQHEQHRKQHDQHQDQELQHQQEQQQQQQQQPPSKQNADGWHDSNGVHHVQQRRGSHTSGRGESTQLHEQPQPPAMVDSCRTKRAREDAQPHPSHPSTHASQPSPFASSPPAGASVRVDGGVEPNRHAVGAGVLVGATAAGVVRVADGASAYRDGWAGYMPGSGGVPHGGGQHGGGLPPWQNRWPDGSTDTFYPYHHVPMRMAGYSFPFAGVPMQYAVPTSRSAYLPTAAMGTAAPGVAAMPSTKVFPHESRMGQSRTVLPLHGVDDTLALKLSSLEGGVSEYLPSEVGHPGKDYGETRGSGSSPSSQASMGGVPMA